jgi:hypothetical protein
MKSIVVLGFIGFVLACTDIENPYSADFPFKSNVEDVYLFKHNVWESGLVDHEYLNPLMAPPLRVTFENLKALNYTNNLSAFSPKHFKLNNDPNSEIMKAINTNINNIDGIFVGVVKPNFKKNEMDQLIISLAVMDSLRTKENANCLTEKVRYFQVNKAAIHFKCTDPDKGTWVKMASNDILLSSFVKLKRGYFVGKKNLFEHIFKRTATTYFYVGYYGENNLTSKFELVALDSPYFTNPTNLSTNPLPTSTLSSPFYMSTKSGTQPNCINFSYSNHGTIRPCPTNCPEE